MFLIVGKDNENQVNNKMNWFIFYSQKTQESQGNDLKAQKKEYRRTPTFVNLKSNTMKNTMQS